MRSWGNCRASQWHSIDYLMSFLHRAIRINAGCITEICSCQLTEWGTCWGESELHPLPALALVWWQNKEHCTSEVNILPMNLPVREMLRVMGCLKWKRLLTHPWQGECVLAVWGSSTLKMRKFHKCRRKMVFLLLISRCLWVFRKQLLSAVSAMNFLSSSFLSS